MRPEWFPGRQMHELMSSRQPFRCPDHFLRAIQAIQSVEASDALRILRKEKQSPAVGSAKVQRQQTKNIRMPSKRCAPTQTKGFGTAREMGAVNKAGLFDRPEKVAEAYCKAKGRAVVCPDPRRNPSRHDGHSRRPDPPTANSDREHKLHRLEPLNWTDAQKRDIRNFVPGQVLVFHKGTKDAHKYEAFTVLSQEGDIVHARSAQGRRNST